MKKIIISVLVIAVVGTAIFFALKFYNKVKIQQIEALDIIPENAAFILKVHQPTLFTDNYLTEEESAVSSLNQMLCVQYFKYQIDSLLNELEVNESSLFAHLSEAELYYSIHMNGIDKFNGLFTFSLKPPVDKETLLAAMESLGSIKSKSFEGVDIYMLTRDGVNYSFIQEGNLLLFSQAPVLIEKVVYTLNARQDKGTNGILHRLKEIEGKDNELTYYLNYPYFYRYLAKFGDPIFRDKLKTIGDIAQYAVMDLTVLDNLVSLNGFSLASDSSNTFVNALQGVKAGSFQASKVLPYNTAGFFFFGAKNYKSFMDNLSSTSWRFKDAKELESLNQMLKSPIEDYFYPWMTDELVVSYSKGSYEQINENTYAFFKVTDIKEATQSLQTLSEEICAADNKLVDTASYRSYFINHISSSYLIPNLFGDLFKGIVQPYYVALEDYIVFGNSKKALKDYLNEYMVGRCLENHPQYKELAPNISNDAHFLCYSDLGAYHSIWSYFLSVDMVKKIEDSEFPYKTMGTFLFEILVDNEGSYTNVILSKSTENAQEESIGWQTALDGDVAWGPYEVKNHLSGQMDVMAVDVHNFLYRIDHRGKISWKIPLIGKPIGEIRTVDYYQNSKLQTLFNTEKFLYLLDVNGNKVENYPIQLPMKATAGLNIIRYEGSEKIRVCLPLADNKVYNYTLEGEQTQGWKYPALESPIQQEVQYIHLSGKDILLVADTSGNVMYANRRGENRIKTKLGFTNSRETGFYKIDHKGESKMLTTDPLGRVVMVNFNGEVSKTLLDEFTAKHRFSFMDFDGDGEKDFLYLDYQMIKVFNQKKEKIFEKELSFQPHAGSAIFTQLSDSVFCVLKDKESSQLHFINLKGDVIKNEAYTSTGNYFIKKATKNEKLRLITVNRNVISNFIL